MPTKWFVFVNGFGLVEFKIIYVLTFAETGEIQWKGEFLLPENITTGDGEKWVELDFYFSENQMFPSRAEAIKLMETEVFTPKLERD